MTRVVAIILHAVPAADSGRLEQAFAAMRGANAARLASGLARTGAEASIEEVRPGGPPFGARLRAIARANRGSGLVVLGSGAVPLATPADLAGFVRAASAGPGGPVLVNNRYSADILALPAGVAADCLPHLPDLAADNGLPRWLADRGATVEDRSTRWRLQVDLDSPLDAFLVGADRSSGAGPGGRNDPDDPFRRVRDATSGIRAVAADPAGQVVVAGRTSSVTLRWLERSTASRTRAIVEERGMRTARVGQRPPRSILGLGLDVAGPGSLGPTLAQLGDGGLVDSRVLLAHRLGGDESAWPSAEDRFASDLLLHESIRDPWLRDLTRSALSASVPILLGGHTLVGPGVRLLLATRPRHAASRRPRTEVRPAGVATAGVATAGSWPAEARPPGSGPSGVSRS